ncbi:MAG: diguanylate cyclase [Candidatus Saganbacteria bacterium]|uniref:Diguanylate cyclase n=1 Tax=Candidatus Saganbacteria bacterium TaxID=2575572 RepID=A0A833L134_UNCSA|nr:MAG: diguanylate cyclase [Candidatus Saganbacteria bacterium]
MGHINTSTGNQYVRFTIHGLGVRPKSGTKRTESNPHRRLESELNGKLNRIPLIAEVNVDAGLRVLLKMANEVGYSQARVFNIELSDQGAGSALETSGIGTEGEETSFSTGYKNITQDDEDIFTAYQVLLKFGENNPINQNIKGWEINKTGNYAILRKNCNGQATRTDLIAIRSSQNPQVFYLFKLTRPANKYVPLSILERMANDIYSQEKNSANQAGVNTIAITDALTGLYSRRHLETAITTAIAKRKRNPSADPLLYFFLDIDHFKHVNDNRGHQKGDEVLAQVSQAIKRTIRGTDTVVRFGGEEFIVVVDGISIEDGLQLAERIRKAIEDLRFTDDKGEEFKVTISIGVAKYEDGDTPTTLQLRADQAAFDAKHSGRNQVAVKT